jgi:FxsC-like protein
VDPWSVDLERHQSYLEEFDRRRYLNCEVLVLWNEGDQETTRHKERLVAALEKTFMRNCLTAPGSFHGRVRSEEELVRELAIAINEVRRRLMQATEKLRRVVQLGYGADTAPASLPLISGSQAGAA